MKRNFTIIVLTFVFAVLMSSCDDPKVAFNEETLDIPYLFSEGYQDEIQYPYDLAVPASDWLVTTHDRIGSPSISPPLTI